MFSDINYSYNREWTGDVYPTLGTADISVHGNYANSNLFEGNIVEFIWGDDYHGGNGPYNTFFRNISKTGIKLNTTHLANVIGCFSQKADKYIPAAIDASYDGPYHSYVELHDGIHGCGTNQMMSEIYSQ